MATSNFTTVSNPSRPYTDARGAAAYLGMSLAWVRAAVFERRIPFVRVGRAIRFAYSDLDQYMRDRRIEPTNSRRTDG